MKKILIAADVNGNFQPLLKRLHKFDLAFCVGQTLVPNEELTSILNQSTKIPKPIYFIDNGPLQHALSVNYQQGGELAPNLNYLGNCGVKKINGFSVAFLSGTENVRKLENRDHEKNLLLDKCNIYTFGEISPIFESISKSENFQGVDILLTCEWPEFRSEKHNRKCSEGISKLNAMLMPRYHFSGNNDVYLQKPPFVNYTSGNLKPQHVCRFISLCKFPPGDKSSKAKGKYLYAFATKPLVMLENEKLMERPSDVQENPFIELLNGMNREKVIEEGGEEEEVQEVDWNEGKQVSDELKEKVESLEENVFIHVSNIHL